MSHKIKKQMKGKLIDKKDDLESKFEIMYFDHNTNQIASLKTTDFSDQVDKLKIAIEHMLEKMAKVGNYELSEITATASLELGFVVFKANGSIEMKWIKSPTP